jgi:two-component system, NtrC family, response regulator HydG
MQQHDEYSIIQNSPCGIFFTDPQLRITFWNDKMQNLTEIPRHKALGNKLSSLKFYNTTSVSQKTLDFRECFKNNKANISKTAFIEDISGNQTLVFINARLIADANGNKLVVFVTDISREITCNIISATPFIVNEKAPLQKIIGHDEKILNLYRMIEMAADSMANVNISGESGTGKELVADAIHLLSNRKNKPFIKVNCSALPETLLESELFGHVKGSFTGAYKDKIGKFEAAREGTIFLDEIGELSQTIQVKLLRVMQEKVIERVGDNKPIKVDMRIITATNKNLRDLVNKGLFREDLFYRLNVFPIYTPPLRDRMNDIPLLVEHFITKFNHQTGKQIAGLTEDAFRIIMDYCWQGNVRELENSIEHAFVICNQKMIDMFDLPQDIRLVSLRQGLCKNIDSTVSPTYYIPDNNPNNDLPSFRTISKEQLKQVLMNYSYNRKETAKHLEVSTVALWKKMKKFELL